MKRSEINTIMSNALEFLQRNNFLLPPFATWSPAKWRVLGTEVSEIVASQLGWDITDFGSGDFDKIGLLIFTIRNGTFAELEKPLGKIYAEKILIVRENQVTPTHFHFQKIEDIINRGGGDLVIELHNSLPDRALADTPVTVSVDGVQVTVPAGGQIVLKPGESVCLPQHLFHKFWGVGGTVLVGEVSRVNDDRVDNYFHEPVGRFPVIDEDVEPLHLLTIDYPGYYRHAAPPQPE